MVVFLLIFIFFWWFLKSNQKESYGMILVKSILSFCFMLVLITEILSILNQLNFIGIISCWLLVSCVLLFFIFKNNSKIDVLKRIKSKYKELTYFQKTLLFIVFILVSLLFYQGLVYPPNNWDSLTYHMSRIMYWLGNENVNHFPTHILRHLYQPPFAEYVILHVNVLQGNDYFSNSIQLFFLIFTLVSLNEILNYLKIERTNKIIAFLFCLTIPSVVLQASTTKNDIVCAYFVITSVLFLIRTYHNPNVLSFSFLGITIGLGMLTKGTFYVFVFPTLLLFLIFFLRDVIKQKKYTTILIGLISVFFIIIINIGYFSRNYSINQHILNIDDVEHKMYSNENMNTTLFISNLLKNVGLHMSYPFAEKYNSFITEFHEDNNISINDTKLNYNNTKYSSPEMFETHEDMVPNTFHIILLLLISVYLVIYASFKKEPKIFLLLIIVVIQIGFFVGYLKWQPWHTRLHIPIFLFCAILFAVFLNTFKKQYVNLLLLPALLMNYYFYFVYNKLRPIITDQNYTKSIQISDNRFKKYFSNQLQLYPEYLDVLNTMYSLNPKKVGLIMYDWEYPLFNAYYQDRLKLVALNVTNITSKINQDESNVDIIITNSNNPFIYHNGKKYTNQNSAHSYLYLYK